MWGQKPPEELPGESPSKFQKKLQAKSLGKLSGKSQKKSIRKLQKKSRQKLLVKMVKAKIVKICRALHPAEWLTLLRSRKPSLRGRITNVFLASFIVFIFVISSSLLLVLNYQMRRHTQFVSHHYATQLAKTLEAYYKKYESWRGINDWLYDNFAPSTNRIRTIYAPNNAQNGPSQTFFKIEVTY